MPYIETYYDYELHKECFRVSDSASYVHTTDTILKLVSTSQNYINYTIATFSLDVIRNLGNGSVAIYDNGNLLRLVTFNENTSKITDLTLTLNYEVAHNIQARYLGNDECLPSKSMVIPINMKVPDGFATTLDFFNFPTGGIIENPNSPYSLTLQLKDGDGLPLEDEDIIIYMAYEGDESEPFTLTTDSEGQCTLTYIQHLPSDFGILNIKAVYETTEGHYGSETETTLYLGYLATLSPILSKYIVGQTPSFVVEAKHYDDSPVANMNVTLWRG